MVEMVTVQTPRCHHTLGYRASDVQLHIFSDASEAASGTVAYLKFLFEIDKPHCSFVMSKTKLAPMKIISLPRLEINAAVLGLRLYKIIIKEVNLPIQNIAFGTGSVLVLQYIRNETHRFKVFVANCVIEIKEETSTFQWHEK